jgi:acetyl esterase
VRRQSLFRSNKLFLTQNSPLTARTADVLRKIELAQVGKPRMHEMSAQAARAIYARGAEVLDLPRAKLAHVQDHVIAGVPCRLYASTEPHPYAPLPVLIYFHGGGFTVGSIETHESLCRQLALKSGAAVISVDYRLAPEHKFPIAFEDTLQVLVQVAGSLSISGLDTARIAVGGDSGGGTLAAACAIAARDKGIKLALQLLFYPGLSAHQDLASHIEFAHGYLIEKPHIDWFFSNYLRNDDDKNDWRFAPLAHADVRGVAPAWIGLAECDPIRDDGLAWHSKLHAANVASELVMYKGVVHDFIKMGRTIPEAKQAHDDAANALRKAFDL